MYFCANRNLFSNLVVRDVIPLNLHRVVKIIVDLNMTSRRRLGVVSPHMMAQICLRGLIVLALVILVGPSVDHLSLNVHHSPRVCPLIALVLPTTIHARRLRRLSHARSGLILTLDQSLRHTLNVPLILKPSRFSSEFVGCTTEIPHSLLLLLLLLLDPATIREALNHSIELGQGLEVGRPSQGMEQAGLGSDTSRSDALRCGSHGSRTSGSSALGGHTLVAEIVTILSL